MPEERKLVTVLFADIVGSTGDVRAHDAEIVRQTLGATFGEMREILVSHGGTVEKFIGDAVMAVFGVPATHDDDPDRAVRAAFALRERIGQRNAGAPYQLALRIGVNTGEAVAGSGTGGEFLVTGEPVTIAARLQQGALPGQILAGPMTRQLTQSSVRYGRMRRVKAKGFGALDAYPAEAITTEVPEQRRGLEGLRAPLIGRDEEMRTLVDAYRGLQRERHAQLLTVFGPPGAGKSRLAQEFVGAIGGARVRRGRCLPYGEGITFFPLQLFLRQEASIARDDTREQAVEKLRSAVVAAFGEDSKDAEAVARCLTVIAGFEGADEALPGVSQEEVPEELHWGLRRYLERRARAEPLVFVVEDIHWAEPALLDFIEDLAESTPAPLLFLCLARPDLLERRPGWGGAKTNATSITLQPLSDDETRRLVGELLDIERLPDALRREIVARAEGNPLYVEEFIRMLVDTRRVERRRGRWTASPEVASLDVPPTLQALIAARVDAGSPDVKRLLQYASIVGRFFSAGAIAALADGDPPTAETYRDAVRRDLLVRVDERGVEGGLMYRFKHVLIRDVVYATVPKAQRAALHDRYGRWYEAALGERRDEHVDLIAYHAEQAYLVSDELRGAPAEALGRRALDMLVAAATKARKRGDASAALALYERAASIAERVPVSALERATVRGFRTLMQWARHGGTADVPKLDAAVAEARAVGPSEILVRLLAARAWPAYFESVERGRELHDESISVARATGDTGLVADALLLSIPLAYSLGDLDTVRRIAAEAAEHARRASASVDPLDLVDWPFEAALWSGDFGRAAELLQEIERLAATDGSERARRYVLANLANFAHVIGDVARAARLLDELLPLEEATGRRRGRGNVLRMLGQFLFESGVLERARAVLEDAVATLEPLFLRGPLSGAHANLARLALALGDLGEARRQADAALASSPYYNVWSLARARATLAQVHAAAGEAAEAERLHREAIAILAPTTVQVRLAEHRRELGAFLLAQGRPDEARPLLEAARTIYAHPLAFRRREPIEALLRQCDEAVARY